MKCANCGFVMPGGAKYCPACGHEVCNAEYQSDDYIQEKDEDFEKKSDYLPIKNTVTYEKLCLAAGLANACFFVVKGFWQRYNFIIRKQVHHGKI